MAKPPRPMRMPSATRPAACCKDTTFERRSTSAVAIELDNVSLLLAWWVRSRRPGRLSARAGPASHGLASDLQQRLEGLHLVGIGIPVIQHVFLVDHGGREQDLLGHLLA